MDQRFKSLQQDLMDYYGTAMESGFPMAVVELGEIENADEDELIRLAIKTGINLAQYGIDDFEQER